MEENGMKKERNGEKKKRKIIIHRGDRENV